MDSPSLHLLISPSRGLRAGLAAGVLLALGTPWFADVRPLFAFLCDTAALLFLGPALPVLKNRHPVELHRSASGWVIVRAGVTEPVRLLPDSSVWPWLMVLRFASPTGTRVLVLLPDSAPAERLRRLRVALRLGDGLSGNQNGIHGPV